jgi:hypothetical protein
MINNQPIMIMIPLKVYIIVVYNFHMSSSEPIIFEECGQMFDTIESLREHQETEREVKELRNKGIDN